MSIIYQKIKHDVIPYQVFRDIFRIALKNWLDSSASNTETILKEGIPAMDEDNLSEFINWSFMRLQLPEDLPERYFVLTSRALYAISMDECIIWTTEVHNLQLED